MDMFRNTKEQSGRESIRKNLTEAFLLLPASYHDKENSDQERGRMRRGKIFGALDRMTSRMQKTNRKTIRLRDSLGEVKKQVDRIGVSKKRDK